ncbi:MAG: SDR family oxidoreductase [Bacteroidota bacterium]
MNKIALVVGVTGITGSSVAESLIRKGWKTYGLSRNPDKNVEGLIPIAADLLDNENLKSTLEGIKPTHVYISTWMRKDTEAENIKVNGAMIKNLLDALSPQKSIEHVALVTGLKHYLGPFDDYAKGETPQTPFREEHPRLDSPNFYYAQEDEVYAAAERDGYTWSIHRPHTVIGKAVGNQMNMGTTLAVYATICKEKNQPFTWPGSKAQWEGISDMTDAKVLADHLIWASTTAAAKNEAFNITNGDIFRWKWMWEQIADYFQVETVGYTGEIRPLEKQMENDDELWKEIAAKYNLKERNLSELASAWHTDLDLSRPVEIMTDMSKSRKLGFKTYKSTIDSFTDLFDELRTENLIP